MVRLLFVLSMLAAFVAGPVGAQPPPQLLSQVEAPSSAPPSSVVQEGAALDMQGVVDLAVSWHPQMRHAQGRLLQAGEGIGAARAGYYPRISAGVNSRTGNYAITGYDSRHVHRAEITVQQTVYDFGKVDSQVDRARASQDVARAGVFQSVDDVVRGTAQAWLEVRRQQAMAEAAQEQLDAVQGLAQLAQQRETEGASTYSDTVQARARVEAAEVSLLTAQSQVRRWRSTLMKWVGGGVLPQVDGEPIQGLGNVCAGPAVSRPADLANDVLGASTVRVAQAQLEVARAEAEMAKSQERPTLSVDATAGRGLNASSRRPGETGADTTVMLNFSMPLYEGGRLQADRRAAEYAVQAARAGLEDARLSAEQGLQDAALQWRENTRRLKVQAAREESMRVTRSLYHDQYLQLGTRSLLDLLNAEQEYHSARRDLIDSEHDMYRSGLDCIYYTGRINAAFGLEQAMAHAMGGPEQLEAP